MVEKIPPEAQRGNAIIAELNERVHLLGLYTCTKHKILVFYFFSFITYPLIYINSWQEKWNKGGDFVEKTKELQEKLKQLKEELRKHAEEVEDPKCVALCETSAEVMQGMETAFEHYLNKSEPAWE